MKPLYSNLGLAILAAFVAFGLYRIGFSSGWQNHPEYIAFVDKNGNERWIRHYESRIASELLRALSDMEQQMGLTPMSRPRIPCNPVSMASGESPKKETGLEKYYS